MASNTAPHCVPWHRPPGQVCCSAGVAKKASEQPGYRFRNLFGMLNEEMLKDSWQYIRKDAACGVDRVSAKEYEQNLDENIHQLVEDLKRKRYRAKHVLRRYIPKGNGKFRPLGTLRVPPRISCCKLPSNACWRPSLSKTFCQAVSGIVRASERWTQWINSRFNCNLGSTTMLWKRTSRVSLIVHLDASLKTQVLNGVFFELSEQIQGFRLIRE